MTGWRFSWRSVIGWAAGALAVSVLYGLGLTAIDVITSPSEMEDVIAECAILVGGAFVIFLLLGGFCELIASVGWRLVKVWPRPWLEMALCAGLWFGLTHGWGIDITFDEDGHPLTGAKIPLGFFGEHIAPVLAGALGPFVYWLTAKPKRS